MTMSREARAARVLLELWEDMDCGAECLLVALENGIDDEDRVPLLDLFGGELDFEAVHAELLRTQGYLLGP